ncbi:helix-turn-helix domain-containing protein [Sphingomonas kaistensis]|uniref:Helix-turn-helix domain-containing protein n=1 Tax=Sphingomonas kaistensis TaxID=298708 RepID=A0ABZ2FZB8_9SPHN
MIVAAFTELAQQQRYGTIKVADLVNAAGVARSTFYENFRSKDEVLVAAMQPILLALATASSGRAARSYVKATVDHLWTRRSMTRPLLDSPAGRVMERHLARAVADHGIPFGAGSEVPLYAVGIAASQLAMLRTWLAGKVTVTADKVTDHLIACAHLRSKDVGISEGHRS